MSYIKVPKDINSKYLCHLCEFLVEKLFCCSVIRVMSLLPFFLSFQLILWKINVLSGQTSQRIQMGLAEDSQLEKKDTIVCDYLRYLFEGKKKDRCILQCIFRHTKHKGTVPLSSASTKFPVKPRFEPFSHLCSFASSTALLTLD